MKSTVRRAYKYRIYPSAKQRAILINTFSMCRYLYNWSLQERADAYKDDKRSLSYVEQANTLPDLKKDRPWFKGVHSQVLQDVLKRLDKGFQAFFRRVKAGEVPGFPKFKKKGQWDSITYPQYRTIPDEGMLSVPKVGDIKIIVHRDLPSEARVKTMTIHKEGDKWFSCFSFEIEVDFGAEPERDLSRPVGIDMGLYDFYYTSDGDHVSPPKPLRVVLDRLAVLQRRFAKEKKYTKRWYKLLKALQKVHFRVRCQRQDFLYKQARALLERYGAIFLEDLRIRNMVRRPKKKEAEDGTFLPNGASAKAGLNRSILDAGWGRFRSILESKSKEFGTRVLAVPAHYTSQNCSSCGEMVSKSLAVRTHECPTCGFVANRDYNAAINILRLGLESLGPKALEAPTIAPA